jgi:hypothetical protein
VTADVAALDQPVLFNRLGASNVNGMIYALTRDLVAINNASTNAGDQFAFANQPIDLQNVSSFAGNVALRPDKRPRPLVLRVAAGDCLTVNFYNLLTAQPNPIKPAQPGGDPLPGDEVRPFGPNNPDALPIDGINAPIDEQVRERYTGFHAAGMQLVSRMTDDGSYVGQNLENGQVQPGGFITYELYAEKEGVFIVRDLAATTGSDANQGNAANLLFGQVIVEPVNAKIYRGQVTDEELRLASLDTDPKSATCGQRNLTNYGQPVINYEARYPKFDCDTPDYVLQCANGDTLVDESCVNSAGETSTPTPVNIGGTGVTLGADVWAAEGKAGLPILNMLNGNEIVHSEINGLIAGPDDDGSWNEACGIDEYGKTTASPDEPAENCPYALERIGKRNPSLPNRTEPFRDFASVWHDEPAAAQAFPGFYNDPVFSFVLAGVKDGFMINYGSGGIGSEIIANRLGVGPMHDCLTCAYEEFFLTSFTVGDPAQLVDVAANMGLENLAPGQAPDPRLVGPKATYVPYPDDPANIHHSYTGDHVKFRNTHVGNEQHVFHLHNHQWLYNPNDDNSNYLDAQSIGPGVGYTYELNFGGAGNRMKSTGDAIFHCHFYPHFAQGMWYHLRIHDVYETGTPLQASGSLNAFHDQQWGLESGEPLIVAGASDVNGLPPRHRALPDGEVVAGAPIPAVVPLPGKAMPPLPGEVHVVANPLQKASSTFHPLAQGDDVPVGSLTQVVDRDVHPGYPFYIGGIEDVVGHRPPTPPLDMIDSELATDLAASNKSVAIKNSQKVVVGNVSKLFDELVPAQADGFDGGLPRAALLGYAAGGDHLYSVVTPIDFSKAIGKSKALFFPEEGAVVEQVAMAYHVHREHVSFKVDMNGIPTAAKFVLNGNKPAVGAPFQEPCMDDKGVRFDQTSNPLRSLQFWSATPGEYNEAPLSNNSFDADNPRIYKGTNIQFDAVINKAGYHYPQQRIITLWEDAVPVISKAKPPEPLVMRFNSFECGVFHHTNLVPEYYELDDYQVRTPTDIIGQHIHLPKWDLVSADGAANGWNYEDGTLSPGAVQERIEALNHYVDGDGVHDVATGAVQGRPGFGVPEEFELGTAKPMPHPYFGQQAPPGTLSEKWKGARTTTQRWFFDPVYNTNDEDRGLGIIFTHDHYGPSTHQQIGLYATVLVEPSQSEWFHNETGERLGDSMPGVNEAGRIDGGPTSWQAMIVPPEHGATTGVNPNPKDLRPHREFYFEYSDFQHAYEAGVYVGADQNGEAIGGKVENDKSAMAVQNFSDLPCDDAANAFRCAINPPAREQKGETPDEVLPDLVLEMAGDPETLFCTERPCPQAIDVEDPGMFVINYRNEPVALRVFDPNEPGPDADPAQDCSNDADRTGCGSQADGIAGDLAFALASAGPDDTDIIRKFEVSNFISYASSNGSNVEGDAPLPLGPTGKVQVLNIQPEGGDSINGTIFPPPINSKSALKGGDPFTPMIQAYAGDKVRIRMQAGGFEEEHSATIHGVKWLQAGSSFGGAPNSGWRNGQPAGISEQFTLTMPVVGVADALGGRVDHVYSMNASQDGYWSGMWGLMRIYGNKGAGLPVLDRSPWEDNTQILVNEDGFSGVCQVETITETIREGRRKIKTTTTRIKNLREYDVTAVLANDILPKPSFDMPDNDPHPTKHVGAYPNPDGGTLVYNSRGGGLNGKKLHDPTAILYVRTEDMVDADDPTKGLKPTAPVEPLVLRAAAGDCVQVTLRNRLLTQAVHTTNYMPIIDADGNGIFLPLDGDKYVDLNGNGVGDQSYCEVGDLDSYDGSTCVDADGYGGYIVVGQPVIEKVADADINFDQMPDMATYSALIGAVKRDRNGPNGTTTFQTNLIQPSAWVGLHAQLVEYDQSRDNGIHAGSRSSQSIVAPGNEHTYQWYAGHLDIETVTTQTTNRKGKVTSSKTEFVLTPVPVEFGGSNLQPADIMKQGMKSMVGQLVVEPEGSTWADALVDLEYRAGVDPNGPGRKTRAMVNVTAPNGNFRDLSTIWQKGLTMYYSDTNEPVEHVSGGGPGALLPEDSQDDTGMAINYGAEPVWYRLGLPPNALFGNDKTPGSFGETRQFDVFSNTRVGVDPQTPVFTVQAGTPTRMRVGIPHGTNRGTTFTLHGHLWQRDPYITENNTNGYPDSTPGVGSKTIGLNPLGKYMGAQDSIWPSTHYDIVLPKAGGANEIDGDYLFRDVAASGSASGLWGILRVTPKE